MRFVMYTGQHRRTGYARHQRPSASPRTKTRPKLEGRTQKSGHFNIGVTTPVYGRFKRKTLLQGQAERTGGITVVRGTVPGGLSRENQYIVIGIMIAVGVLALAAGNAILAVVAVLAGAAFTIPMQGDYDNAELLLTELSARSRPA